MRYCVKLMRAPVVNAEKNEKLGNVKACLVHPEVRRVTGFLLASSEEGASDVVVPFGDVVRVYQNAVMVRSGCAPFSVNEDEGKTQLMKTIPLIGAAAVTREGVSFGVVSDFAFAPESGEIVELVLDDDQGIRRGIPAEGVLRMSRENVIIAPARAEAKPVPPPPAPPAPEPIPEAIPVQQAAAPPVSAPEPVQRPAAPVAEPRISARAEVRTLLEEQFQEQLRAGLREVTSILMDRINAIDSNKHFEKLKNDLAEALRPPAADEDARRLPELLAESTAAMDEKLRVSSAALRESLGGDIRAARDSVRDFSVMMQDVATGIRDDLDARVDALREELVARIEDVRRQLGDSTQLAQIENIFNARLGAVAEVLSSNMADRLETARTEILSGMDGAGQGGATKDDVDAAVREAVVPTMNALRAELRMSDVSRREEIESLGEEIRAVSKHMESFEANIDARLSDMAKNAAVPSDALRAETEKISVELGETRDAVKAAIAGIDSWKEPLADIERKIDVIGGAGERFDAVADDLKSDIAKSVAEAVAPLGSLVARIDEFELAIKETRGNMSDMSSELHGAVRESSEHTFKAMEALRGDMTCLSDAMSQSVGEWTETMRGAVQDAMAASFEIVSRRIDGIKTVAEEGRAALVEKAAQLQITSEINTAEVGRLNQHVAGMRAFSEQLRDEIQAFVVQQMELRFGAVEQSANITAQQAREQAETAAVREELIRKTLDRMSVAAAERGEGLAARIEALRLEWESRLTQVADEWQNRAGADSEDAAARSGLVLEGMRAELEALQADARELRQSIENAIHSGTERTVSMLGSLKAESEQRSNVAPDMDAFRAMQADARELRQSVENAIQSGTEHTASMLDALKDKMEQSAKAAPDMDDFRRELEERVAAVISNYTRRLDASMQLQRASIDEDLDLIRRGVEQLLKRNVFSDIENVFSGRREEGIGSIIRRIGGAREEAPKLTPRTKKERDEQMSAATERQGPTPVTKSRLQYLVGRKVQKDILDEDGACLVPQGSVVDEPLIERMREMDRVVDLVRSVDFNP